MRFFRCRRGQIVIPALFIFPSLMLFVYLIFETAKLSREKIRHQFAIDAAAFVEMTNYSDFLNRTAYVNGPFPMRIFDEGFKQTCIDCDQKANCHAVTPCATGKSLWDILYDNGAFPRALNNKMRLTYDGVDNEEWDIGFGGPGAAKNNDSPSDIDGHIEIITMNDANGFWVNWDDANQIYKLYVQIYQLLGSVEEAQYSVLTRLAGGHNFFKKSYWLNTGDNIAEADLGAATFETGMGNWAQPSIVKGQTHKTIQFHGNKPTGSAFQPWQVYAATQPGEPKLKLPDSIKPWTGLFQYMWVSPAVIKKLRDPVVGDSPTPLYGSRGIPIKQPWTAPGNYFNHDFNAGTRPYVHVSVSVGVGSKARVWPNPTPKFQVRTYP